MAKLTPKQVRFVEEYLVDANGTQAAIRAGYSPRTANEQAARMLTIASVRDALDVAQRARSERVQISADWVLGRLVEIVDRTMQAVEVADSQGIRTGEWKFEASAAIKALELCGRHLGMFANKVELGGPNGGPIPVENVSERELAMRLAFVLTKGARDAR